jgi:hypothetical protein
MIVASRTQLASTPGSMPVASIAPSVFALGRVIRIVISVPFPSGSNFVSTWLSAVGVGQVRPLHVNDPAEWRQFIILAGQLEPAPFAVRPFVTNYRSWPRRVNAHRHRPAVRAEKPFLDQTRLGVRAVDLSLLKTPKDREGWRFLRHRPTVAGMI